MYKNLETIFDFFKTFFYAAKYHVKAINVTADKNTKV